MADRSYTQGVNNFAIVSLLRAGQLFPLSHYFREGAARLVIKNPEQYERSSERLTEALLVLREAQHGAPNSGLLKSWADTFQERLQKCTLVIIKRSDFC